MKELKPENLFIFPFVAQKPFLHTLSFLITWLLLIRLEFDPFWFHRTYRIFYYYESDFYSPVGLNLLLWMCVHTICACNCSLIMSEPDIFMWMGIALTLHIYLSHVVIFTIHLKDLLYYFYFMCVVGGLSACIYTTDVPKEGRKEWQVPWKWSNRWLWAGWCGAGDQIAVLCSSSRSTTVLSHLSSPSPLFLFFWFTSIQHPSIVCAPSRL